MKKFYFTYGTEGHPYYGGWTEIEAPNRNSACALFRALHPDKTEGLLNCCDVYTEEAFRRTTMNSPDGNFGFHCHERITVTKVII